VQEIKREKEKPAAPPEPAKARPAAVGAADRPGGVGVSELRNKLGSMMMNAAQQPHPPPGAGCHRRSSVSF